MKPRALALGFLLVFATLAIGGAVGSPQPAPVCRACGTGFAQAAEDSGYNVSVVNSTATVRIHENGSATWTVTNRLDGEDADSIAAPGAAESVARGAVNDGYGLPHVYEEGDLSLESVAVDDRSVTIRFTDPDAGTRRLGTLVVDYFHSDGVRGGWILDVDEFTLVGPPNATVLNDPAGVVDEGYSTAEATPTVDGRRVTWHGSLDEDQTPIFYDDLYVVYGDSDTADWRATGATALSTAPIWLDNVWTFVAPTALIFGGALYIAVVGVNWLLSSAIDSRPRRIARAITALGAITVVAGPVVPNGHLLVGIAALYLVAGGGALITPRLLRSLGGTAVLGGASLAAVGAAYVTMEALVGGSVAFEQAIELGIYHLPVAGGLIVGHALARCRAGSVVRPVLFGTVTALASWFVAGGVYVPVASRPFGVILVIMVFAAVVAAVAAAPLVALTARASEIPAADAEDETTAKSSVGREAR
ncbi:hypothetical protein [Halosimplex sp. J119]